MNQNNNDADSGASLSDAELCAAANWWKPTWKQAPKWAGALGLDGYGNWYWLSHDGNYHTVKGRRLIVRGGLAWSELAMRGPRDFRCTEKEALAHFEKRHNKI